MRTYLLPKGAVPLDAADPSEEALPYEHLLVAVLEGGGEVLAASEHAFYYVAPSGRFLARSQLYYLLSSPEAAGSRLLSAVAEAARALPEAQKPYAAAAMLSDALPLAVFSDALSGREWRSPADLAAYLASAGRAYLRGVSGCDTSGPRGEAARLRMATFAEVLEFLGARAEYGLAEDGSECVVAGGEALAISSYLAVVA